jgi:hypothetical protein
LRLTLGRRRHLNLSRLKRRRELGIVPGLRFRIKQTVSRAGDVRQQRLRRLNVRTVLHGSQKGHPRVGRPIDNIRIAFEERNA